MKLHGFHVIIHLGPYLPHTMSSDLDANENLRFTSHVLRRWTIDQAFADELFQAPMYVPLILARPDAMVPLV